MLNKYLNGKYTFKDGDDTYEVSLVTMKIKNEFAKALFIKARDGLILLKDALTKQEYMEHLFALNEEYMAGGFDTDSERGQAAMQSESGVLLMSSLLFGTTEEKMIDLFVRKEVEVMTIMKLVLKESRGLTDEQVEKMIKEQEGKKASKPITFRRKAKAN